MADPQSGGPPQGPVLPSWPPPAPRPGPPPALPPGAAQHHPHFASRPPFSSFPGPPGMTGFAPGFASQQHHYYYPGPPQAPPPFPFRGPNSPGLTAVHAPFGPPPPPRGHTQFTVGTVPPIQSPGGRTSHAMSGNGITPSHGAKIENASQSPQLNRTPAVGIPGADDLGLSRQAEGIGVIEKAILHLHEESRVDAKQLLSEIRVLVGQAEEAVQKVGEVVMLDPSMLEPHLAICPFDPAHRVPPKSLFKHFLCCPSNPKSQEGAEILISAVHYPRTASQDCDEGCDPLNNALEVQTLSLDERKHSLSVKPNYSALCVENLTEAGIKVDKDSVEGRSEILRSEAADLSKTSTSNEIDIWGGRFFYKDSSAVVQAPLPTPYPALQSGTQLQLMNAIGQRGVKVEGRDAAEPASLDGIGSLLAKKETSGDDLRPLLSSRLWFLLKEIEMWNELPTRCSSLVLQAATGLGRIRKKMVLEWLLMQGSPHGVVLDFAMASHIYTLTLICLTSLQKAAFTMINHQVDLVGLRGRPPASEVNFLDSQRPALEERYGPDEQETLHKIDAGARTEVKKESAKVLEPVGLSLKVTCLDCPHLFQSGHWLTSQLSSLFGPLQSKAFVLKLLKHCLVSSGRFLASFFIHSFSKGANGSDPELGISFPEKCSDVKLDGELQTLEGVRQDCNVPLKSMDEKVEKRAVSLEVEAATAAVHERAVLESYLRTQNFPSRSKFQMIQEHEAVVTMAATERSKRSNYKPVSEHDGLIWHRSQQEDKTKNKTREELLAEERDYKRRRMSYRGKKLKRNPTEVLHDIIEGYMSEILEAGGIGRSTKHSVDVPPSSVEGAKVESSKTNLSSRDYRIPVPLSNPVDLKLQDSRDMWKDHSREKPVRRDDWSNERSTSRTFRPQDKVYTRMEADSTDDEHKESGRFKSDGSQGKYFRHDSHHSADRHGKGSHSSHSRSGRDRSRSSKGHREDTSVHNSDFNYTADRHPRDYERDRSYSQRHSQTLESSLEEDTVDRHHSSAHRGKSDSRHLGQ